MTHSFEWSAGYASQRLPVFGRNVVATSHPIAGYEPSLPRQRRVGRLELPRFGPVPHGLPRVAPCLA